MTLGPREDYIEDSSRPLPIMGDAMRPLQWYCYILSLMKKVFGKYLCKFVLVLFDDILIYSRTLIGH
jgi:hypothetical protein